MFVALAYKQARQSSVMPLEEMLDDP
jgi:hypothetical protein